MCRVNYVCFGGALAMVVLLRPFCLLTIGVGNDLLATLCFLAILCFLFFSWFVGPRGMASFSERSLIRLSISEINRFSFTLNYKKNVHVSVQYNEIVFKLNFFLVIALMSLCTAMSVMHSSSFLVITRNFRLSKSTSHFLKLNLCLDSSRAICQK